MNISYSFPSDLTKNNLTVCLWINLSTRSAQRYFS